MYGDSQHVRLLGEDDLVRCSGWFRADYIKVYPLITGKLLRQNAQEVAW